jgi:hypothetical protein
MTYSGGKKSWTSLCFFSYASDDPIPRHNLFLYNTYYPVLNFSWWFHKCFQVLNISNSYLNMYTVKNIVASYCLKIIKHYKVLQFMCACMNMYTESVTLVTSNIVWRWQTSEILHHVTVALMMEAVPLKCRVSFYEATWCNIAEGCHLHTVALST